MFFYTATWCDDYFKDSRSKMSKRCIKTQNQVNLLFEKTQEYRKYKVKIFPIIIVLHGGKEVYRTSGFSDLKPLYDALKIKE